MEYGLIGEHLSHSFSKNIHSKLGNDNYELTEIAPGDLDAFMKKADFKGINVTIPYKQTVIPYLYQLSDTAKEIGAVNTIVNRSGKLYGYNTDFDGMKLLIQKNNIDLNNSKVLILGTGGTSRTASFVAYHLKASQIFRVSRHPQDSMDIITKSLTVPTISYDEAYSLHTDADVIINTTPLGMFPHPEGLPIDIMAFTKLKGVIDAIYNPLRTRLILKCKNDSDSKIKAEGGLYMLVSQGIKASELFFDTTYPDTTYSEIYHNLLNERENIVLTGMPGSGKSTLAQELSIKTGKKFFDTDVIIKEQSQMEISDIFDKFGENHFRELESNVIKELSSLTGIIISTGGGAILRNENISMLKSNGHIYYIDRDIDKIIPTSDRPLSSDIESLKKRYDERHDLYQSTADTIINNNGELSDTISQIIQ